MEQLPGKSDELPAGGKEMSLWEHLADLRGALVRAMSVILILFFIAMFYSTPLIQFLSRPLISVLPNPKVGLHFTGPMDVFVATIKVSGLFSVLFGSPVWTYQFWKFVEPGLYPGEKKLVVPFALASITLFFIGAAFCFFVILPMTLGFMIGLGTEIGTPIITINDYLSMVMIMIIGFGIIFETPIVLILLSMVDLIDAKLLREYRGPILVVILVVSAVLTPPDPISQIAMAIPVYAMFEASIVVISLIEKRKT